MLSMQIDKDAGGPPVEVYRLSGPVYTSDEMLQVTTLHSWHRANGAKMAEFAEWDMPIQYSLGAIEEHRLVRRSAGLFDVSHMGQLVCSGPGATAFLDQMLSSDIASLPEGHSTYALLCREDGGVLDDVFVYRLAGDFLVVVNAANTEKDARWLADHLPESGVDLDDFSPETAMFAFQGPQAVPIMDALTGGKTSPIPRFGSGNLSVAGISCTVGRTGYTGEDGVELFLPSALAQRVWEAILEEADRQSVDCGPVGLAARDSLRFEPGFPLYGHELSEEISPIQARLKWACNLEKDFIGASALRRQAEEGVPTKLATVIMKDRGVPRQGYRVLHEGEPVGVVASGMYAPTVDAYAANVFVTSLLAKIGSVVEIEIRNRPRAAVVTKRPLYRPAYR